MLISLVGLILTLIKHAGCNRIVDAILFSGLDLLSSVTAGERDNGVISL